MGTSCQTETGHESNGPVRRVWSHNVLSGAVIGASADTQAVLAIVALLVVIGIGLVMLAVWLFRVTRPDRELLAPLEVMGARTWRRGEPVWQRRRLDEVRPADAVPASPAIAPPAIDAAYDAGPSAPGFADLSDPELVAAADEPDQADPGIDESVGSAAAGTAVTLDDGEPAIDTDDEAVGPPDQNDDDDTTVDGVPSDYVASMSDDVTSTPPIGVHRADYSSVGPSARPEASLADLAAAATEQEGNDGGPDAPVVPCD